MSKKKRRKQFPVEEFADAHYEVLGDLRQKLETLKAEMARDYDKRDLDAFVTTLISNFGAFEAELHGIRRLEKKFGLDQLDNFAKAQVLEERLHVTACRLLFFAAVTGKRAKEDDFKSGIELIKDILSDIGDAQNHCRASRSQKG